MKRLSIATVWEETSALVKRDAGPIFLISFGLIALPTIILQAVAPDAVPGQGPRPGIWMLLFLPVLAISTIGSLTITALAVGSARDPRTAFGIGLRRFLTVIAAAFLIGFGAALCAIPVVLLLSYLVGSERLLVFLTMFFFLIAFLALWTRLMLMAPVAAAESGGPVAILRRSWALTRGETWRLLSFVLLMIIVFLVLTIAVTFVGGSLIILAAGQPRDGNLSSVLLALLTGLVNAVWGAYFTVMAARIYAQLTGASGTTGS